MKTVTILRDMRPWRAGDDAHVPDAVAAQLIKSGDATNSRPFPPADLAPKEASAEPPAKPPRGRYFTRKAAANA